MAGLGSALPLLGFGSGGSGSGGSEDEIVEGIGLHQTESSIRARLTILSQGVGVNEAPTGLRGIVLSQGLGVALAQIPNHHFNKVSGEALAIAAAFYPGLQVSLTQGIGMATVQQASLGLQIIEDLGLAPVMTPTLKYGRTLSEAIGISETLARFLGVTLTQGIGVHLSASSGGSSEDEISEGIGLHLVQTPRLILKVTSRQGIGIDDADALRMLFSPVLRQGIEIAAAYLSPGDGITTWAMNTRTAAVTEYDNYAFNSFARLGNTYLGASADGLYELTGDDDAGTDIVARIKSGFAQWAGTRQTLFKAAYLGVRGEGDFILRLITGEGATYDYAVQTRDMRSTKVHMGKGIRTRYFAFELISTGQDFDLESIEFVPLVADRRV